MMEQARLTAVGVSRPALKARFLRNFGLALLAGAALTLIPAGSGSAAPAGEFTMFDLGPAGEGANAIASGPDGNMWFTNNANNSIGRITPSGAVTYFAVPTTSASASTGDPGLYAIASWSRLIPVQLRGHCCLMN